MVIIVLRERERGGERGREGERESGRGETVAGAGEGERVVSEGFVS